MNKAVFTVMASIAIGIYLMQKAEIHLPEFLNNYLNDLLCLPLVLGGISFAIRRLKKDASFKFPLFSILLMATYYSIYFEYYLPNNNQRYTSDWIDVFLYFSGAIGFYCYEKIQLRKFEAVTIKRI